jgi:hypothetical protein
MRTELANPAAAELLIRARALRITSLDAELESYLKSGLALQRDGTIVSIAALRGANADRGRFPDRVGYEAFVNKMHLDDWCSDALAQAPLEEKLAHGLVLADRVGTWAVEHESSVVVVISADVASDDIVFRFHGVHAGEPPWLTEIESCREPVVVQQYSPGEPEADPSET